MKKHQLLIFIIIFWLTALQQVNAYSKFTESEHQLIDSALEKFHNDSKASKALKAEIFSRIANQSAAIINILSSKEPPKLSEEDKNVVKNTVEKIQYQSKAKQTKAIEKLQETKDLAEELERSFQIESEESFNGYWITILPTPIYRSNEKYVDINRYMGWPWTSGLKLDESNLINELGVVLPVGTAVTIIKEVPKGDYTYYAIRTREFDTWISEKDDRFVDSRFIEKQELKPKELIPELPSKEEIITNLKSALWTQYIRWGSEYRWIPEINEFYPTPEDVELTEKQQEYKILKGVDCSWLLRQSTNWYTPRNTSWLLNFWASVPISWNTVDEIIEKVEPLDIIDRAWHVIVILDKEQAIESIYKEDFQWGTEIVDLIERLTEIMTRRAPVNERAESNLPKAKKFVIRRRYPNK